MQFEEVPELFEPIFELAITLRSVPMSDLPATPGKDAPALPQKGGTAPAHAILAPPAPTDYFARDRKGNVPMTAPEGAEFAVRKIVGTAKTAKFLKIILANSATANCFDPQIWPVLERQEGKETGLWIKKSEDGKYLNVVGVRS
jgi:hypothetical protein